MKCLGISLLLLTMLATASTAQSTSGPFRGVREVTLPNGLRLLLAPDSTTAALDVAVWYGAGTTFERAGRTGISHLFEHLMFRGSAHVASQEHSRLIQAEGGTANAYTAADLTCYYESLPREGLELAFRLEADRMTSLDLTQQNLDAERRVIREEKRWRARTNLSDEALTRLQRLAFATHPYRWPIIGLDEDLDRITLADCQEYFRARYAPNNALITVVGNFDPEQAVELARRSFGGIPRRNLAGTKAPAEPAQTAARRATEPAAIRASMLLAGWRTPPDADPDMPALELIAYLLGNGATSRLNMAMVVNKESCVATQAALDSRKEAGLFYVVAILRPGADSVAVEHDLVDQVEMLARAPLPADEFEQARRRVETQTLFGLQTARARARSLGTAALLDGDWRAAGRRLERLHAMTPADLQRAAARVLQPSARNLIWLTPASPGAVPAVQGGR